MSGYDTEEDEDKADGVESELVSSCNIAAKVVLQVRKGDLTTEAVDAIVNAANCKLQHYGGLAWAIVKRGGDVIQDESDKLIAQNGGPVAVGSSQSTSAGKLPCKHVIHTVGPIYDDGDSGESKLLSQAVESALAAAEALVCKSMALPAISSGIFGYPLAECCRIIIRTIMAHFASPTGSCLREIRITNIDDPTVQGMRDALRSILSSSASGKTTNSNSNSNALAGAKRQRDETISDGDDNNSTADAKPAKKLNIDNSKKDNNDNKQSQQSQQPPPQQPQQQQPQPQQPQQQQQQQRQPKNIGHGRWYWRGAMGKLEEYSTADSKKLENGLASGSATVVLAIKSSIYKVDLQMMKQRNITDKKTMLTGTIRDVVRKVNFDNNQGKNTAASSTANANNNNNNNNNSSSQGNSSSNNNTATNSSSKKGWWEWEESKSHWSPFDKDVAAKLESSFTQSGPRKAMSLRIGGYSYSFDLTAMTQTNQTSGNARNIRRRT